MSWERDLDSLEKQRPIWERRASVRKNTKQNKNEKKKQATEKE